MDSAIVTYNVDLKHWEKLRSKAIAIYSAGAVISGLIMTGYYPTMYEYIKGIVIDENTEQWYSIVLGTACILATISSLMVSIYYDFTKNVKQACICSLILVIIGNVMYLLPYSIYIIMFGYALVLCQTMSVAAMVAEINHIVPAEQLTVAFSRFAAFRGIGLLLGPCLAIAYAKVDIKVGSWTLEPGNMPSLVYGGICFVYIFVLFSLKNLAKLYDLKAVNITIQQKSSINVYRQNVDIEEEAQIEVCERKASDSFATSGSNIVSSEASEATLKPGKPIKEVPAHTYEGGNKTLRLYFSVVRKILLSKSYTILWFSSLVPTFIHNLVLSLLGVVVYETLKSGIKHVSYAFMVQLGGGIISTLIVTMLTKYVRDVWMAVGEILITMIPVALLIIIPYIEGSTVRFALFYIAAFINGVADTSCDILSTVMVGKVLQPEYQGIGESVRLLGFYIAYSLSSYGTGIVFNSMLAGGCTLCALNLIMAFLLIYARKRYH